MTDNDIFADYNNRAMKEDIRYGISKAQSLCYAASIRGGWWDQATRQNPLVVPTKLMLIVSEIAEAMEAHRKNLFDDKLPSRKGIEVELADAVIRIFDLAGFLGLDLAGALLEKIAYNESRADHKKEARDAEHGKKF